jgi:predicted transcriptional regulator
MIKIDRSSFLLPTKAFRRLSILLSVHHTPDLSQHKIAEKNSLSSSMVNKYIKELVSFGYIKISNRNNRDVSYQLTKNGREQMLKMLIEYSAEIVQLYSQTKNEIISRVESIIVGKSIVRVVLFGASETCELVIQALKTFPEAKIVGIVDSDPAKHNTVFNDYVIISPEAVTALNPDYVIITSFARQDEIFKAGEQFMEQGIKMLKLSGMEA